MDAGRRTVLIAWIECDECGRIDKAAHDFSYPADNGLEEIELFVWIPWARCGRHARLQMRRDLKPLQ
jgi:hypothetical protein